MIRCGRNGAVQLADHDLIAPDAGVHDDDAMQDHDDGPTIHQSNVDVNPGSEDDISFVDAQMPTLANIPRQTQTQT